MRHVDDVHQSEDDDEPERHQQQRQNEVGGVERDDDGLSHAARLARIFH